MESYSESRPFPDVNLAQRRPEHGSKDEAENEQTGARVGYLGPQGCRVDPFPHGPVLGVERVGVSLEVDYIAQLGFLFDAHVELIRGFVHRCQIIQWSHCLSVIWRGMGASLDQIRHVL
ncbi:hypothetical protein BELL_0531g00080 [Botrytis elliptica]|uniref:Uncharacterized protein n=1 Tax=Botrytis elliptica TaxID=278938 RepID=A0A4Z1JJW9_9HELO|nr:hypothetical protein BELL_0531g00080 [Botrytis elliptica]